MEAIYRPEQFEPRRVRLTQVGRTRSRTLFGLLGLMALIQVWAITGAMRQGVFKPMMLVAPAFVLFGLFIIRTLLNNEKELLLKGTVATGFVTEVAKSPKGAMASFDYEDAKGQKFSRTARDTSGALKVGDPVPVFYDVERPGRCVITPGSFYELE